MARFEEIIKAEQIRRVQNIALSFKDTDEELVKGLTEDEFNTKYPKDEYEIYTEASLGRFSSELRKAEQTGSLTEDVIEKAKKDISKLQKKTVIGKDGKKHTVYVKISEEGNKSENKHSHEDYLKNKYDKRRSNFSDEENEKLDRIVDNMNLEDKKNDTKVEYKKGDKFEYSGETVHVGHDTSGGQSTITYKAPSVSDKTYYDLDKLKKVIEEGKKPNRR